MNAVSKLKFFSANHKGLVFAFCFVVAVLAFVALPTHKAMAANGDIVVNVKEELGSNLAGATVEINCSGGSFVANVAPTDASGNVTFLVADLGDSGGATLYHTADCDTNAESITYRVSKDGYVTQTTGGADTYLTGAETDKNITGVQFAYKLTAVTTEGPGTNITATLSSLAVGASGATDACTLNGGAWYCPVTLAHSVGPLIGVPTQDGYVQANYNLVTGTTRSANADAQVSDTISTVRFSYKITSATSEIGTNITAILTTLRVGDDTATNACTFSVDAWYCPVILANSNGTLKADPVKEGYVQADHNLVLGTTRVASSDAQITDSFTGVQYAYKITSATSEALAVNLISTLSALAVGDATATNACETSGGAWYCPVVLANSDGTLLGVPTQDGYVQTNYNLVIGTTRVANNALQISDTIVNVQYAYKITSVTTEGPGTELRATLSSLTVGDDTAKTACALNGTTWYCPVILANSNGTLVGVPTQDGYVSGDDNLVIGTTRVLNTAAQVSDTISTVRFAYKITAVTAEGPGTNITATLVSLAVGDDTATTLCTFNVATWYCPVILANSDGTLISIPIKDGYVQANYNLVLGTTRLTAAAAQVSDTVTGVRFSYKITSATSEIGTNITAILTTLAVGDDTTTNACAFSVDAWYCPVVLANSNGTLKADPVKEGYVQADHNLVLGTTRLANLDAQIVDSFTGVQFAYKITSVTAEGPGTNLTATLAGLVVGDVTGTDTCILNGGAWYCPVVLANSDGTLLGVPTQDGYVAANNNLVIGTTRGTNAAAQVSDTITGVDFAYKITAVTTEGPGTNLTATLSSLVVGDDTGTTACALNGGAWYCPVLLANSDGTLIGVPTQDGYVAANNNLVIGTTRITNAAAQVSDTISTVKFSYKLTAITTEGPGTNLTATLSSLVVGDVTGTNACILNGGAWYCPVLLANSDGTLIGNLVEDGYVQANYNLVNGTTRAAAGDPQRTETINTVQFAYKITGATTEISTDITAILTTLAVGDDSATNACTFSVDAWYCPVILANSNGTLKADPVKEGYVRADHNLVLGTTRLTNTAAQISDTFTGVQFAYKITSVTAEAIGTNLTSTLTGLLVGDATATNTCVLNTGAWYCPVVLANSDGTLLGVPTQDGYVQANHNLVTGTTRVANTDAQRSDTITNVLFALKVTIQREGDNAAVTGSTVTADGPTLYDVTCAENGTTGIHYCVIPVAQTGTITRIVNPSFITKTLSYTDRTTQIGGQGTMTAVLSTSGDITPPTITGQTPADGATGVSIIVSPTITFNEAMDAATLNGGTIQIRKYSDDTAVSASLLYNPSTFVVTLTPVASLVYNTQYYLYVVGAKDAAGNSVSTDYAAGTKSSHEFTTVAEANGSLAVTGIDRISTYAVTGGDYANGWKWTFHVTVPTTETSFKMKFTDLVSGTHSIAAAANMRFFSSQSSNAYDESTAISITVAEAYSSTMTLNADLSAGTAGRQIDVTIEARVPTGTAAGSYSTSYGIQTTI